MSFPPLFKFQIGQKINFIPKATFKGLFGMQFKGTINGKEWCLPHHQQLNQKLLLHPRNKKVEIILVQRGKKHQETKYYINSI